MKKNTRTDLPTNAFVTNKITVHINSTSGIFYHLGERYQYYMYICMNSSVSTYHVVAGLRHVAASTMNNLTLEEPNDFTTSVAKFIQTAIDYQQSVGRKKEMKH